MWWRNVCIISTLVLLLYLQVNIYVRNEWMTKYEIFPKFQLRKPQRMMGGLRPRARGLPCIWESPVLLNYPPWYIVTCAFFLQRSLEYFLKPGGKGGGLGFMLNRCILRKMTKHWIRIIFKKMVVVCTLPLFLFTLPTHNWNALCNQYCRHCIVLCRRTYFL